MSNAEFGPIRGFLFPIHLHEWRKFLPLGLMMFFVLFNYTILRNTKDTLVIGAAGGEAISFVKLYLTLPIAVLFFLVFSKLSSIFNKTQMFYISVTPFVLFFGLFAYVIYPNQEFFHPGKEWISNLVEEMPRFAGPLKVFGTWTYAIFYVMAELWGSVVLSLLFWQTANGAVKIDEAKRFYPMFGVIANVGTLGAGLVSKYFSNMRGLVEAGVDPWGQSLNYLMGVVVISSIGLLAVYSFLSKPEGETVKKKAKVKLSMGESMKFLLSSKHLGLIAILVLCYGVSINLVEALWKNEVGLAFENPREFSAFMGGLSIWTGALTIVCMFIGGLIVRKFGWLKSAILTPLMILLTGIPFFFLISFDEHLSFYTMALFGAAPSMVAVMLGFAQNLLSKSTKYSLFDPTKEMAYIPLDEESKIKGKAAVDVVGGRLGKSGGAAIQQVLFWITGSKLRDLAPVLGILAVGAVLIWLMASKGLDKSIKKLTNEEEPVLKVA